MSELNYRTRRLLDLRSFLGLFRNVRTGRTNNGIDQYEALCPAHEDTNNSLAIGYCRSGRYLVHCHAGCSPSDVLAAVGLSLADLYPDAALSEKMTPKVASRSSSTDDYVLLVAEETRKQGGKLSKSDKEKERQAWLRTRKRGHFA